MSDASHEVVLERGERARHSGPFSTTESTSKHIRALTRAATYASTACLPIS
jgi:hypothetical protein